MNKINRAQAVEIGDLIYSLIDQQVYSSVAEAQRDFATTFGPLYSVRDRAESLSLRDISEEDAALLIMLYKSMRKLDPT